MPRAVESRRVCRSARVGQTWMKLATPRVPPTRIRTKPPHVHDSLVAFVPVSIRPYPTPTRPFGYGNDYVVLVARKSRTWQVARFPCRVWKHPWMKPIDEIVWTGIAMKGSIVACAVEAANLASVALAP